MCLGVCEGAAVLAMDGRRAHDQPPSPASRPPPPTPHLLSVQVQVCRPRSLHAAGWLWHQRGRRLLVRAAACRLPQMTPAAAPEHLQVPPLLSWLLPPAAATAADAGGATATGSGRNRLPHPAQHCAGRSRTPGAPTGEALLCACAKCLVLGGRAEAGAGKQQPGECEQAGW